MYRVIITGSEAVSWRFLEAICDTIKDVKGARLQRSVARDAEGNNDSTWYNIISMEPVNII